eukprot:jgi/Botrbrau1/9710/Bobra.0388s0005.1
MTWIEADLSQGKANPLSSSTWQGEVPLHRRGRTLAEQSHRPPPLPLPQNARRPCARAPYAVSSRVRNLAC